MNTDVHFSNLRLLTSDCLALNCNCFWFKRFCSVRRFFDSSGSAWTRTAKASAPSLADQLLRQVPGLDVHLVGR